MFDVSVNNTEGVKVDETSAHIKKCRESLVSGKPLFLQQSFDARSAPQIHRKEESFIIEIVEGLVEIKMY
jgi:hypothetical protein